MSANVTDSKREAMNTETSVRERPILFKPEMVRAILEGRKTVTRRIVKDQCDIAALASTEDWASGLADANCYGRPITEQDIADKAKQLKGSLHPFIRTDGRRVARFCPYGQPGDHLYVRESFWQRGRTVVSEDQSGEREPVWHSTGEIAFEEPLPEFPPTNLYWRKKPGIHMPRSASRLTLEITDVRIERVQDITEEDAKAEGFASRSEFEAAWKNMHGVESWDGNVWVWKIQFVKL